MIAWKMTLWRTAGVAGALALAACGGEAGEGGPSGERGEASVGGESGEVGESGERGEGGAPVAAPASGEAGEAGALSAYAGVSGDQLIALRLQHLRGFVMAAEGLVADRGDNVSRAGEAAVLVQQGLLEVYDAAPDQFGALDVSVVRAAADGGELTRAQMMQRLRASQDALDAAFENLDVDHAALAARMVDIATGLYQGVVQEDFVDPVEYQHSRGAALAARRALRTGEDQLRRGNLRAFSEAQLELDRFAALWPSVEVPETPSSYRDVLAQGSRVRLALSPYL